jgi:hypothetical protein
MATNQLYPGKPILQRRGFLLRSLYREARGNVLAAHAVFMFAAWGLLAPAAVGLARYGKGLEPRAGPAARWFQLHSRLNYAAWTASLIGFGLAVAYVANGALGGAIGGPIGGPVRLRAAAWPARFSPACTPEDAAPELPDGAGLRLGQRAHLALARVRLAVCGRAIRTG